MLVGCDGFVTGLLRAWLWVLKVLWLICWDVHVDHDGFIADLLQMWLWVLMVVLLN